FHTRTVLSLPPDTMNLLSGDTATVLTDLVWPLIIFTNAHDPPTAHTSTLDLIASRPTTTYLPSGLHANAAIKSLHRGFSSVATHSHVPTAHTRTFLS